MGFNPKTKKNEPNRLYLSKLDVKATDVYLRGEYGQKSLNPLLRAEFRKSKVRMTSLNPFATSGISKIESPHDC